MGVDICHSSMGNSSCYLSRSEICKKIIKQRTNQNSILSCNNSTRNRSSPDGFEYNAINLSYDPFLVILLICNTYYSQKVRIKFYIDFKTC